MRALPRPPTWQARPRRLLYGAFSAVLLTAALAATPALAGTAAGGDVSPMAAASTLVNGLPAVIPQPVSEEATDGGGFTLDAGTAIVTTSSDSGVANYLAGLVRPATGLALPITSGSAGQTDAIVLDGTGPASLGDEGYTLTSDSGSVVITAHAAAGLFHGVETLRQLLPTQIEDKTVQQVTWTVPAVSITDTPRYAYRGIMIDVARHFYSVGDIERVIDQAAMYKLDVLHLHLSDDQGWRIAINAYPDLTTVGSTFDGRPGYYTQADYESIVAYAAARYITVVPEIDGPAHTTAAVTAMATGSDPADIPIDPANSADNANVEAFLTTIAAEIGAMSPGPYFHIGGDESSLPGGQYDHWVTAAGNAATAAGKIAMGWSQVGGDPSLPAGSVLQYWAAKSGNDTGDGLAPGLTNGDKLVLSPSDAAYFDMKYDTSTPLGLTWAGYLPLSKAYDWNPDSTVAGIIAANHLTLSGDPLLGVEAPLWADTVPASWTPDQVPQYSDFMLLPRIPALAEVAWSPESTHDWTNFSARVATQGPRWNDLGYGFYASPEVAWIGYVAPPTIATVVNGSSVPTSPDTLAGTGVAGDTVTITEGSATVCSVTVGGDGTWSCTPATALSTGSHQLSVVQTDADGYQSTPVTVAFTVGAKPILVDDWSMNETSGTTVADSAGPYNGTRTGSTKIAVGEVGNGLTFDGTNSPVNTGAPDLSAPWTVGLWVNPSRTAASATVLSGSTTSIKLQQYNNTGKIGITQSGVADYVSTYGVPLNAWTYVTLVDDGTGTTVYANGQQVSTIAASVALGRSKIGTPNANEHLYGSIDELTVFSSALTGGQVASLYAAEGVGGGAAKPVVTNPVNGSAVPFSPPTISGTEAAGATVTVLDGTTPICSATAGGAGTWSCAPSSPLSSGTHQLSVEAATDTAWAKATTVTVTVGAAPKLVDDWSFDQSTGKVTDSAGGYNGTVTGTTAITPGKVGNAATFDGTNSPITTGAPSLAAPWSVGVWVDPAAVTTSAPIIGTVPTTSVKLQQWQNTGQVGLSRSGVADWTSGYSAPLGTWTYLTLVDDGTLTRVYANGVPVGTIAASITLNRADIGTSAATEHLVGSLDELSVFSNALTADQVAALYTASGSGGTFVGGTGWGATASSVTALAGDSNSCHLTANGDATVAGGSVAVNGTSSAALCVNGSAKVTGAVSVEGGVRVSGTGSVPADVATGQSAVGDPQSDLVAPTAAASPSDGQTIDSGSTYDLAPGTYTQALTVPAGATVCLAPGIYVLDAKWNISAPLLPYGVTGCPAVPDGIGDAGVLLYFAGGHVQVNDGGNLSQLSAMQSGPYAGMLYWQAGSDAAAINGAGAFAGGGWYAPNGSLTLNGAASLTAPYVVAKSVTVNGESTLTASVS